MTIKVPGPNAQRIKVRALSIGHWNSVGRWLLVIGLATVPLAAAAQATQSSSILTWISAESQKLYESVRPSLVVIRFPAQRWIGAVENDPLRRWEGRIDPSLQRKLEEAQRAVADIAPVTQPSTQPATQPAEVVDREINTGPRFLGLVVDENGHVVLPIHIDRESIGDLPIDVTLSSGRVLRARFVGSDRRTNLTVLRVEESPGHPILLGTRPNEGSLVMALAASGEAGQLLLWTGGMDDNVIVVSVDGKLAGFARGGQFLSGESCRSVIDQLIQHGHVKRATLGVAIMPLQTPDGTHAVRVIKVIENSPAAQAGLQQGDIILSLKGHSIPDITTFAAAIAGGEGATKLEVLRNGEKMECEVILKPQ